MKKTLLLSFLFCFLLSSTIFAQGLRLNPNTPVASGDVAFSDNPAVDFAEFVAHSTLYNDSDKPLQIAWERRVNNLPSDSWNSLVCDPTTCWPPQVSTNNPDDLYTIPAGGSALLDVHFQPSNVSGSGFVELYIWAINDPSINLTARFEGDGWIASVEDDLQEAPKDLKIYPNPVRADLNIDIDVRMDIGEVEIYNLVGRKIASYYVEEGLDHFKIATDEWQKGMYLLSLFSRDGELLTTKVVSKLQ